MMSDVKLIILLCSFGFLKEFRPSEPFLSPFLCGPKNFTQIEVNNDIYPVGTYSNMTLLIVIFLLTDWLRYKPILILQGISGVITWSLLAWGDTMVEMQIGQIAYGLFSACDVAYFAYLYAKLDKKKYQKATAQVKTAILVSKSGCGVLAQLLVMYKILNYLELIYLTLGALCLATVWATLLPSVEHSFYFNKKGPVEILTPAESPLKPIVECNEEIYRNEEEENSKCIDKSHQQYLEERDRSYDLKSVYMLWYEAMKNVHTLKWSLWAALSLCGYLQVTYYIQLLWQDVINSENQQNMIYHGFSNSFNSLAGALCTYAVGYLQLDWSKFGEISLAIAAMLQGAILTYSALFESRLIIHYVTYAAFKILYLASSIIASAEIAKSLMSESYGLVLGVNQFIALVEQSVLTLMVTRVFTVDIKNQFTLYGIYFFALGTAFLAAGASTYIKHTRMKLRPPTALP